eukprot:gene42551-56557_t
MRRAEAVSAQISDRRDFPVPAMGTGLAKPVPLIRDQGRRTVSRIEIPARPFPLGVDMARTALIIIDMQRDFLEPGGFGDSLGNDVSLLQAIAWRAAGGLVVHTREAHRPDLSDCPPAKRLRGNPSLRIGDPGPMGRVLIAGEPGNQILPELAPVAGEIVIDKPGKGAFYATDLHLRLQQR